MLFRIYYLISSQQRGELGLITTPAFRWEPELVEAKGLAWHYSGVQGGGMSSLVLWL